MAAWIAASELAIVILTNALVLRASPIGQVAIVGPGAGPQLAGQGVFSDLIAVARSRPTAQEKPGAGGITRRA